MMSMNRAPSAASGITPEKSPVLRRSCGCGGSCGPCSGEQEKKKLQRSPERSSRFAHDFSAVPATRSIDVRVGPAGDAFEREADRVADAVAGGGSAAPLLAARRRAQRQMDDEGSEDAPLFGEDEGDEELEIDPYDDPSGQPKLEDGASHETGTAHVPVGSGGGTPLERHVRTSMQERIGHDFSSVRVHHDSDAARAAASVHARAFTVGSDIYFAQGRYEPSTATGQRLLAHELTHVVQQSGGSAGTLVQRDPEKKKTAPKKEAAPKTGKKDPAKKKKPPAPTCGCAKKKDCDGTCAPEHTWKVVHPWCSNEECPEKPAVDGSFFIKHIDVNLKTQTMITLWGDDKAVTAISDGIGVSPNKKKTPPGPHTIGVKCTACHTNFCKKDKSKRASGMAWFTGFANTYQYGFHNSQEVGPDKQSSGCVRVGGVGDCACAKSLQENTSSGVTSVCVHSGKPCIDMPEKGDPLDKTFCGEKLFKALPPKKKEDETEKQEEKKKDAKEPKKEAPAEEKEKTPKKVEEPPKEEKPAPKKDTPPAPPKKAPEKDVSSLDEAPSDERAPIRLDDLEEDVA